MQRPTNARKVDIDREPTIRYVDAPMFELRELVIWWTAATITVAACAPDRDHMDPSGPAEPPEFSLPQLSPGSAHVSPGHDDALTAAYVLARQRDAGPTFRARREAGRLIADNPAHGLTITFEEDGVTLGDHANDAWQMRVRVDGYGCPLNLDAVNVAEPTLSMQQPNRVDQDHVGVRAWYLNGPLGLEQGFDALEAPPCLEEEGALTVAMTVEGLLPSLGPSDDVVLRHSDGRIVLRYDGLYVVDAEGTPLSAALRVSGQHLFVDVEAGDAIFPLVIDPMWSQQALLLGNDSAASDVFGDAVAVSGDTAVIGAPSNDTPAGSTGAAYVFVRSGATWTQQAKLVSNDAAPSDHFGRAVDISGDTVVVGAEGDDDAGPVSGAAYVFVRNGTTWGQQAKLTASDAAGFDWFGGAVSIDGDLAVIGAADADSGPPNAGAAYVYIRAGNFWSELAKLTASDAWQDDWFGSSVSVQGSTVVVGAPGDDVKRGAAYVFVLNGLMWTEQARLTASDRDVNDYFGHAVSVSSDTTLVGAYRDDTVVGSDSGSVYVYERNGSTWSEQAKLTASDAEASARFGNSVSLEGDTAAVGAYLHNHVGQDSGAAYVFGRSGTTWTEQAKLTPNDAVGGDHFATSLSLSGSTVVIGSPLASIQQGKAYAFAVLGAVGEPCPNGNGDCLNGQCADGYCCDAPCSGECVECASSPGACQNLALDTPCGNAGDGQCDLEDSCDGAGTCVDHVEPSGTVCGDAGDGACDLQDSCDGAGTCVDETAQAGTTCDDGDACTGPDTCIGGECQPGDDICDGGGGAGAEGGAGGSSGEGGAGASTSEGGSGGTPGAGAGGTNGAGGSSTGLGASGEDPGDDEGCSCATVGHRDSRQPYVAWYFLFGLAIALRRLTSPRTHRLHRCVEPDAGFPTRDESPLTGAR